MFLKCTPVCPTKVYVDYESNLNQLFPIITLLSYSKTKMCTLQVALLLVRFQSCEVSANVNMISTVLKNLSWRRLGNLTLKVKAKNCLRLSLVQSRNNSSNIQHFFCKLGSVTYLFAF